MMTSLSKLDDKQAKIIFVIFFVVLGLVGNLEFEDIVHEAELYQDKVCSGIVPDYKQLKPEC
jgi:hypothetical protein